VDTQLRRTLAVICLVICVAVLGYALVLGTSIESTPRAVDDADKAAYVRFPAVIGIVAALVAIPERTRVLGVLALVLAALAAGFGVALAVAL